MPPGERVGPAFFRAAWIVAAKDLRLEWRTLHGLSAMGLFSLVVLVVFSFAFDVPAMREIGPARLLPGILWVTFAFAAIVGFTRSFQLERHSQSLAAMALAPVDRGAIYTGKAAANFVQVVVLETLLLLLAAVLFDEGVLDAPLRLAAVTALHTLGLAEIGTLLAALATGLGRGEALLATLLLPAATPLLLSAVRCTGAVLAGEGFASYRPWILVAAGLDVLYFFVALLVFEFLIED